MLWICPLAHIIFKGIMEGENQVLCGLLFLLSERKMKFFVFGL